MTIAEVVPLHKLGNEHRINNDRPVYLLLHFFKILKKKTILCQVTTIY